MKWPTFVYTLYTTLFFYSYSPSVWPGDVWKSGGNLCVSANWAVALNIQIQITNKARRVTVETNVALYKLLTGGKFFSVLANTASYEVPELIGLQQGTAIPTPG